jgi:hypothetical protein
MASTLAVQQSRVIPVSVDDAFAGTLPLPLTTIFTHWYGPIPPIRGVRDQVGEWSSVGQTRVVLLTGAGAMHETLTSVDPPRSFTYTITGITGPLGLLVGKAEGEWRFTPYGWTNEETLVTWQWTVHAASALTAPLLPLLGALWRGYARQALKILETELPHR